MFNFVTLGGLEVINKASSWLSRGGSTDSLVSYTQVGRVEPLTLIDQDALHLKEIGEVQQSLLAVFSGYYLQAAALSNTIGAVKVLNRLDALNPNRDPLSAGIRLAGIATESISVDAYMENCWTMAAESYENGLPFVTDKQTKAHVEALWKSPKDYGQLSAESFGFKPGDLNKVGDKLTNELDGATDLPAGAEKPMSVMGKTDVQRQIQELANLSVGKAYEINITDGKATVPVQVNIRLQASMVASKDLIHILATGSEDNSWKERWHGWRSGKLGFWKDLVMCNDLIDKHRSDLMKDRSGSLSLIASTNAKNSLSTLLTANPSIASASNIAVLTKNTADELELQLEGKLIKYDIRQRMMKKTSLMLLAIIDPDYATLTIYSRGISLPTTVRLADLKSSNKGSGPDVGDILKALMGGHPPSL